MGSQYFRDIEGLTQDWVNRATEAAVEALTETAAEGADGMRQIIHTSITPWGQRRQRGEVPGPKNPGPRPYAGRIEEGNMIGDVDHSSAEEVGDGVYEAKWGWEDPENYYITQDQSFERQNTMIAPMEALKRTLEAGEDAFLGRLDTIGGRL